jgi:hypothetical protein
MFLVEKLSSHLKKINLTVAVKIEIDSQDFLRLYSFIFISTANWSNL